MVETIDILCSPVCPLEVANINLTPKFRKQHFPKWQSTHTPPLEWTLLTTQPEILCHIIFLYLYPALHMTLKIWRGHLKMTLGIALQRLLFPHLVFNGVWVYFSDLLCINSMNTLVDLSPASYQNTNCTKLGKRYFADNETLPKAQRTQGLSSAK